MPLGPELARTFLGRVKFKGNIMVGLFEWVGGSTAYNVLKDVVRLVRRKLAGRPTGERLERRAKWKPVFEELILTRRRDKTRSDVIIRDVSRMDHYPDQAEGKGISPWFKVGLVGTYHRGIEVALGIHSLVWEESEKSWRLGALLNEASHTETAYLIGYIPYNVIDHVDLTGDEYYSYPHIYCHFAFKGQPYEKLAFCERKELFPGSDFYTELESVEIVKLTSEKFGTAWMWRT
jgi:hypothetical protein